MLEATSLVRTLSSLLHKIIFWCDKPGCRSQKFRDKFYKFPKSSRNSVQFISVQSLSRVQPFATPWIATCQASPSITNSWSSLKLMPIKLVMLSSRLILCCPLLLLPPIPPASGSFPMSQLFTWGGQSIGVSASTSQGWSPLGWTGWISLQSKGLSRVFSNTTVQKHQFFGTQLSL